MIEILVIVALCGLIGWQEYQNRKERNKLINVIISKNAQEVRDLGIADQTRISIDTKKAEEPDVVSESEASQEEWDKAIGKEVENL
jgi:hypothetical protein